jgi:predicted nucleic acid-binding protein
MTERSFFDSNLFLYSFSKAPADEDKKRAVRQLLKQTEEIHLSTQVMQEFISAALRKAHLGISEATIDQFLELTRSLSFIPLTHQLIAEATRLRRRYQLSHWDSTIVAAALAGGCHTLYSEDLQDGLTIDRLTIRNPFRDL